MTSVLSSDSKTKISLFEKAIPWESGKERKWEQKKTKDLNWRRRLDKEGRRKRGWEGENTKYVFSTAMADRDDEHSVLIGWEQPVKQGPFELCGYGKWLHDVRPLFCFQSVSEPVVLPQSTTVDNLERQSSLDACVCVRCSKWASTVVKHSGDVSEGLRSGQAKVCWGANIKERGNLSELKWKRVNYIVMLNPLAFQLYVPTHISCQLQPILSNIKKLSKRWQ